MRLFRITAPNWLSSPPNHDIIARWTWPDGDHRVHLPQPRDPERFTFLALGDTGDSEGMGAEISPQDAVAAHLSEDAALPGHAGSGELVLHTGDVVYMTGEKRLYDRNFRRPYARFLTEVSHPEEFVFRLPFLPVPGNHDYYDMAWWAGLIGRLPLLGEGIRVVAREFFTFNLSRGGSEQGRAFMDAFMDGPLNASANGSAGRLREESANPSASIQRPSSKYVPGQHTRLPNRYYQFTYGTVDFFALDSNTLDCPPPPALREARADAAGEMRVIRESLRTVETQLRAARAELEEWTARYRHSLYTQGERSNAIDRAHAVVIGHEEMATHLREMGQHAVATSIEIAARRWRHHRRNLETAPSLEIYLEALRALDAAYEYSLAAIRDLESRLSGIPTGPDRDRILALDAFLEETLRRWVELSRGNPPSDLRDRIQRLASSELDLQRSLALERRRRHYQPRDYDTVQLRWLDEALSESVRERPGHWRVVYLHHPLYTSISNHCEHPDIEGVRENLLPILQDRVHLVLSGHTHAFEWLRAASLPHTGLFVTGGGGQVILRGSVLDPVRFHRYRKDYAALRRAGVAEVVAAGQGPPATDGEAGLLYHYLRVHVQPDLLRVQPIGVRRTKRGYRREAPIPTYYAAHLPDGPPPWEVRALEAVEIQRKGPPRPVWATS